MTDTLGDRIRERRDTLNRRIDVALEGAKAWAQSYTDDVRTAVQTYVDNRISALRGQAQTYVDNKIAALCAANDLQPPP